MTDNSFSLIDLYPKYVINSKGEKKKFDENNIPKVLNKETGLDMTIAEKVAEDVIRKIIGIGVDEITTNYIRELVCVELTQRGLNKYRNLFARAINLENISFKIDEDFLETYKGKQPEWGPLGYITYKRTYARIVEGENRKEEFWETIRRVVEGCYSIQKEHCIKLSLPWTDEQAQNSAQRMYEKIWNFKMVPPGRGLWMMGTEFIAQHGSMALNNCFSYETEIITKDGIKQLGNCVDTEQELLTTGGKWVKAPIKCFGKQKLMEIVLTRQGQKKIIYATPEHRWFAKSRGTIYRHKGFQEFFTKDLKKYFRLPYIFGQGIKNIRPSPFGIAHGICFGDGCQNHIFLCSDKNKELLRYFPLNNKIIDEEKCNEGAIKITEIPLYFKERPSLKESKSYLFGWLAGYFAADGTCKSDGVCIISSSNKENIEFVKDVCTNIGIGCYTIRTEMRVSNLTNKESTMYHLNLMTDTLTEEFFLLTSHRNNFNNTKQRRYWSIESVEMTDREEQVYCPIVEKYHAFALENNILTGNCGFASTEDIDLKYSKAFEFVMDALMLGVGVGFDTKGAGKITIKKPIEGTFTFQIPDNREGWVEALKLVLEAYFLGKQAPVHDFSLIRPAGQPIRGFGGVASGPDPLKQMLADVQKILENREGQRITSIDIVDIMNLIGKCVVAGNVRRSAEIALGDPTDLDFITCKQDKEKLYSHRWASNNSVFAAKGLDYSFIAEQIAVNGEPGVLWLENARAFSRMGDTPDYKDKKAAGVNPCITGDTLIAVADGRNAVPIKQLAEEGKDVPVYCKDNKGITIIRMMRNPRITGFDQDIYEVQLDDGSIIRCTGNHKFTLKDLKEKESRNLKPGDSLIITSKWQTTWSEIMGEEKKKKTLYWVLNDGKKNIFEHTLVYEQLNNSKILKGYVIHHRDKNGLNNNICNLEAILKDNHEALHDISGDNNPMRFWFSNASPEEQQRYCKNMSKITSGANNGHYSGLTNDEIYNEMISLIRKKDEPLTVPMWKVHAKKIGMIRNFNAFRCSLLNLIKSANRECGFEHLSNPALMREYKKYIQLLKESDLELIYLNGIMVIKHCELCGREFKVKYGKRERAYCSHDCANKIAALKAGATMREKGNLTQKNAKQKLFVLFDQYVSEQNEVPSINEFLMFIKQNGINDFRTAGIYKGYQYIINTITERYGCEKISVRSLHKDYYRQEMASKLKSSGLCYNHKISSVKKVGKETVYNGTVDEFHNFGIAINEKKTYTGRPKMEIVYTANCGEQTLESFELCCLVETFPSNHASYEEFQETLKYAYLYAKSVTLVNTHWKETNAVMLKNRRMGISQTGIIDAFVKHGRRAMLEWCEKGYKYLKELDSEYSDWLCVPKSIKLTTVKPSGTVSLLAGASSGIHYPHSEYYVRRIRISKNSDLIDPLREAGFNMEDDLYSSNSYVIKFPIHEKHFDRSKDDVSIWEQAQNAADYQRYWSDNQVSITITFKLGEAKDIKRVLESYEDKLKSVSFLPIEEHGYEQAPLEEITAEQYEEMVKKLKPLNLEETRDRAIGEKYCDKDTCEIRLDLPKSNS